MADLITGTPGQNALKEARTSAQVGAANLSSFRTEEGRAEAVRADFDTGADSRVPGASATTLGGRPKAKGGDAGRARTFGKTSRARGQGGRGKGARSNPLRNLTPEQRRRARRRAAEGVVRSASSIVDQRDGDASDEVVADMRNAAFRGADAVRGGLRARDATTAFLGARREGASVPQAVRRALVRRTREVSKARAAAKVVTDMGIRMRVATTVRAVVAAVMAAVTSVVAAVAPILLALLPIFLLLFVVIALSTCFSFDTSSLTEDEAYVASYLAQREFSTPAIAAVLGNMKWESGFNPALDADDGNGNVSMGLVQMMGSERDTFSQWCSRTGLPWDTAETQCRWIFSGDDDTRFRPSDWTGGYFSAGWYQSRWSNSTITGSLAGHYTQCGGYQEYIAAKIDGWYRTGEDFRRADDVDLASFCWMACYEVCAGTAERGFDQSGLATRLQYARDYLERLTSGSGQGQEYVLSDAQQKAIVDACHRVGSPGSGLCAMWVSQVYQAAGLGYPGGNADDMYDDYTWSSDRSDLKVGMIVAVDKHDYGGAYWHGNADGRHPGNIVGHVAIYIGDGQVMHNVGSIQTMSLDSWISVYGRRCTPRWGFAAGDTRTL